MDYILGGIIVLILALAMGYIIRAKKNGVKCIGCSSGASCGSCSSNCDGHHS